MPELPEVETTAKSLNILKNKKVTNLHVYTKKLRYPIPYIKLKRLIYFPLGNFSDKGKSNYVERFRTVDIR